MKTCEEMVSSLLERRGAYKKEKRIKKKKFIAALSCFCLAVLLGLGVIGSNLQIGDMSNLPMTDETPSSSAAWQANTTRPSGVSTTTDTVREGFFHFGTSTTHQAWYAIVKIHGITKETVMLSQRTAPREKYVKVNCEILYSYNTASRFHDNLDEKTEIYVTEDSVEKMKNMDTILIQVEQMNLNGKYYYGPATNDDGHSEYLPIQNGCLIVENGAFTTRSFDPLRILNQALDEIAAYLGRGGMETEYTKALPKQKIESGMRIDEIVAYFEAWEAANAILEAAEKA